MKYPNASDTTKKVPVLFFISCQNYEAFPGFRLNNQGYTAYPEEEEVLLSDGCKVYILSVEEEFIIKNTSDSFKLFNNKKLTIIHMFLPDPMNEIC